MARLKDCFGFAVGTFHFIKQEEKLFGPRLTQLGPKALLLVVGLVAKQKISQSCKSLKPSQSLEWNASKSYRRSLLIFVTGEGLLKMSIDHDHVVKAVSSDDPLCTIVYHSTTLHSTKLCQRITNFHKEIRSWAWMKSLVGRMIGLGHDG